MIPEITSYSSYLKQNTQNYKLHVCSHIFNIIIHSGSPHNAISICLVRLAEVKVLVLNPDVVPDYQKCLDIVKRDNLCFSCQGNHKVVSHCNSKFQCKNCKHQC